MVIGKAEALLKQKQAPMLLVWKGEALSLQEASQNSFALLIHATWQVLALGREDSSTSSSLETGDGCACWVTGQPCHLCQHLIQ